MSISNESEKTMGSTERARRRDEKRPASGASTVPSPSSHDGASSDDNKNLPLNAPAFRRMIEEANARHRAQFDNTSDARERRKQAQDELRKLRNRRVDEDWEFAFNLAVQLAVEDADRDYAQRVHSQQFEDPTPPPDRPTHARPTGAGDSQQPTQPSAEASGSTHTAAHADTANSRNISTGNEENPGPIRFSTPGDSTSHRRRAPPIVPRGEAAPERG
ncbi:hypothetical protein B0H12DRAFT_1219623 [Mycena haematopus]|nr:hypothetical protein B0H12DRAFT_1219623 [Mycena haematopus]